MRIGMFVDCDLHCVNGVVRAIETYKTEFQRLGHELHLFLPGSPAQVRDQEADLHYFGSWVVFFMPDYRLAYPLPVAAVKAMRSLDLDVVHLHTPFTIGLIGLAYARMKSLPLVVTHHTRWEEYLHYLPLPGSRVLLRPLASFLLRSFDNVADVVTVPSQSAKEFMIELGVRRPIVVIPGGIEPGKFQNGDGDRVRRHLGIGPDAKVCITVSRMAPEKRQDFILRAFVKVAAKEPAARLIFVGEGPFRRSLEALAAELGLAHLVYFTGYVPDLRDYLAAGDTFLFASVSETLGMVLVEAMAARLPIVAIGSPGVDDSVVHRTTGFLTSPDPDDYANHVLELLGNQLLRQRFAAAAASRAESFRINDMVERTLLAYEMAAKGGSEPRSRPSFGA